MEAVILAGGKGSRLASRSNGMPKPLVPADGKPLLAHQFELLARYGVKRVTLLCGYGADAIREFCARDSHFGLDLACIDESAPLGTAGAVIAALERLPAEFLVLYGDTMVNIDLHRFYAAHSRSGAQATLFLHPNDHPWDSDLVETAEDGHVLAIHGCPHPENVVLPNRVNAALYILKASALAGFTVPEKPLDFAKDVFPEMLRKGLHIHGYCSPEYVKDAGTPERLDKVECDLRRGIVDRSRLDVTRPAIFIDRDGTINEEVPYLTRPEQFQLIPGSAEAVRILREAGYRVVVVTNQPVIARGDCSSADLGRIHDHMETELSREGAFLDGIYFCPHHPHKGFPGEVTHLKIDCDCRKPGNGMLRRAARELNLDLRNSWLVGDRTGDMQAAHSCGMRSILVRTGIGGNDRRYSARPDQVCDDLLAAARFILTQAVTEAKG